MKKLKLNKKLISNLTLPGVHHWEYQKTDECEYDTGSDCAPSCYGCDSDGNYCN